MFKNLFLTIVRLLKRNSVFTIINVLSLMLGILGAFFISIWMQDELRVDRHFTDADRIYRLERVVKIDEATRIPLMPAPFYDQMPLDFPEIETITRFFPREVQIADYNDVSHKQQVHFVDPDFFDVFQQPSIEGDFARLAEPGTIFLSQSAAVRYFGEESPVGKSMSFVFWGQPNDFEVVGVYEDIPPQSHFSMEVACSFSTLNPMMGPYLNDWLGSFLYTYIKLKPHTDLDAMAARFPEFINTHMQSYGALVESGPDVSSALELVLQPITSLYLDAHSDFEVGPTGSRKLITIFAGVGILLLLIAAVNYTNLTSALMLKRSRETGMRMTLGSKRSMIAAQYIMESVILALCAWILAMAAAEALMPLFKSISGKALSFADLNQMHIYLYSFITALSVGIIAGIYPGLHSARQSVSSALKGEEQFTHKRFNLRIILVVSQFTVSLTLILLALIVTRQINYMASMPLGYETDHMLVIPTENSVGYREYLSFREELLTHPEVTQAASSYATPADNSTIDTVVRGAGINDDGMKGLLFNAVDEHFTETYNLNLVAGADFESITDATRLSCCLLNETAVRYLGFESAQDVVGARFSRLTDSAADTWDETTVIGVVNDFHVKSLHQEISPFMLVWNPMWMSCISVRLAGSDEAAELQVIQDVWHKHFPHVEFNYSFVDERVRQLYQTEYQLQFLIAAFSGFILFVACLGLFGLTTFTAQKRAKEMGVRKVLGASPIQIYRLMVRDVSRIILVSWVLASIAASLMLHAWLRQFAYHVTLRPLDYLITVFFALGIAIITISSHSISVAHTNPTKMLHYE